MTGSLSLPRAKGAPPFPRVPLKNMTEGGRPWALQPANDQGTLQRTADCPCLLLGSLDTGGPCRKLGDWATVPPSGIRKLHHRCQSHAFSPLL